MNGTKNYVVIGLHDRMAFEEIGQNVILNQSGSKQRAVVGFCEPQCSIKHGKFVDYVSNYYVLTNNFVPLRWLPYKHCVSQDNKVGFGRTA